MLVEEGKYDFIFKSKLSCEKKGNFYPSPGNYFSVVVKPPSTLVLYAQVLRVPYMRCAGDIWGGWVSDGG